MVIQIDDLNILIKIEKNNMKSKTTKLNNIVSKIRRSKLENNISLVMPFPTIIYKNKIKESNKLTCRKFNKNKQNND